MAARGAPSVRLAELIPAKNRKMSIQAIDIHEFKDGKIVRTGSSISRKSAMGVPLVVLVRS